MTEDAIEPQGRRVSRWRRWRKGCIAGLVGLALVPVVVEVAMRIFDPLGVSHFINMKRYMTELVVLEPATDRIAVHRPDFELDLHGWDIRTNSHGLRGPERAIPKPPDVKRIVFVGDSVTFGWGVDEEDTFTHMVETELNARGEQRWEAVNAGHLYHDSTQERAVLEEVGLLYEPDIVVLVFVGNDIQPTAQMRRPAAERPVTLTEEDLEEIRVRMAANERVDWMEPVMPFTHRFSRLVLKRWFNWRFKQREGNEQRDPNMLDRAGIDFELGWNLAQKAILEMRAMSVDAGAHFLVLDSGREQRLETFCEENGIDFGRIVLSAEEKKTGVHNSSSDPHHNRNGNRYHADKILRVFDELSLVPEDGD